MFKRERHKKVAQILNKISPQIMAENRCYFAGGTAIALRFGEFRESVDIDFMTSDITCYSNLRNLIREENNLQPLLKNNETLELAADVRADQYGIRTKVRSEDTLIKFEIVLEGRIQFEQPSLQDTICGLPSLTLIDAAASKILANSDRGLDSATHTRDILDLVMMDLPTVQLQKAAAKATEAYGKSALADLKKVIQRLETKPYLLEENMQKLSIELTQAVVWQKLRKLEALFND